MTTTNHGRIDAAAVRERTERREPITVIDVRTPAEFETARIPGSVKAPLALIEKHAGQLAERLDRDVVLVCRSGVRARQAQQRLAGPRAPRAGMLADGVGAGRTVSALTDTCSLGRVLSSLPYNRGPRVRTPEEIFEQLPTGSSA